MNRRKLGFLWERKAEAFLRKNGLKTIQRNFNCRCGEIDLIMEDQEHLVFVEVRYRRLTGYGSAAETVGFKKQARIIRAASLYLAKFPRLATIPCRFDVISVDNQQGKSNINWIKNAFETSQG